MQNNLLGLVGSLQLEHLVLFPPFACMLKRDPLLLPYYALTPNSSGPGCLDTLSLIDGIRGLQRMLDLSGGTLEALSITFFPPDADFASAEQLNLACLPKLRWLHINIATRTTEEACPAIGPHSLVCSSGQ
ncbi:hypothetical protein DXG03_002991 [Asterophora parasitica]|uniref:Uncharacterized protein n=1 Tax=Asterophora parasitica TaxID=117018 RepID=A0A9P7K9K1_9AGAR|nr:hypothetical protein DXG03_002991 [Asterophora parasitica]